MKHLTILHKIFSNNSFPLRGIRNSLVQVFSILLLGSIITTALQAQTVVTHNIGTDGNLIIPGNSTNNYIVTGTTTTNIITVQSGYKGTITLRNLNITSSKTLSPSGNYGMSGVSCITVEGEYNGNNLIPITRVEVTLEGNNTLTYTANNAGCAFQVNQGAQVHINSIDRNDNTKGKLTATTSGTGSAGIGAPYFISSNYTGQGTSVITNGGGQYPPNRNSTAGGNIIIGSGTVVAKANAHGAGIGGAWYTYYNGIIIVYGGDVSSTSGMHAAGIGSGCPRLIV